MELPKTLLAVVCSTLNALSAADTQSGAIEFFGYKGIDIERVRNALPFREGDLLSSDVREQAAETILETLSAGPTDVTVVCCDPDGLRLIYIGFPGESRTNPNYNREPAGEVRLPGYLVKLSDELEKAEEAAVLRGGDAIVEDRSKGYSLIGEPAARALQLTLREYVLDQEAMLAAVLASSNDARHRALAAQALGYVRQSQTQLDALANASLDPDEDVRNNAVRALGVLADASPEIARAIAPDPFIELLRSGIWTDRNKAAFVLERLTRGDNAELPAKLNCEAREPLLEMAAWRGAHHSHDARLILARINERPITSASCP